MATRKVTLDLSLPETGSPSKSGKTEIYLSDRGTFALGGESYTYTVCVYRKQGAAKVGAVQVRA